MSLSKTVGLFAGTTLTLTSVAFGSTEANTDALKQIADLRAEIASMKAAASGDNWLTEQRSAEIKGLVQDVLADADTRSSLQGAGGSAGWDNGFFLASADGNFRLNVSGGGQARWSFNRRSGSYGDRSPAWGFQTATTELAFSGHIVDPSWQYRVSVGLFGSEGDYVGVAGETNGSAYLKDMFILKDFGGWYLKAGQFQAPYSRERLMSDYTQSFIARSNSNYVFGLGRTQGIEAGYLSDMFRVAVAYADGLSPRSATQNAGYPNSAGNVTSPEYGFSMVGRVEVKLAGNWKQFEAAQSWRGDDFALMLGVGGYWQTGQLQPDANPQTTDFLIREGNSYGVTADATAGFGGFDVYGAFYYSQTNDGIDPTSPTYAFFGTGTPAPTMRSFGALLQGGFFLTDDFQLVARYEYGDVGGLGTTGATVGGATGAIATNNLQSIASFGANWYFAKNRAKWQADFGYSFVPLGVFAQNGNGWQLDYSDSGAFTEDQWLFRTAVTFSF